MAGELSDPAITTGVGQFAGVVLLVGTFLGALLRAWNGKKSESAEVHREVRETLSMNDDERPLQAFMTKALSLLEKTADTSERIADGVDAVLAIQKLRRETEESTRVRNEARIEAQEELSRRNIAERLERIDRQDRQRHGNLSNRSDDRR